MPAKGSRYVFDGDEKTCKTCGEIKPIEAFPLRGDRRARRPHCRKCINRKVNDSEAGMRARLTGVLKCYNISIADFQRLVDEQGNLCAICRGPSKIEGRRLHVDHCHVTDKVRGLLCNTCNAALGLLNDDPELFRVAALYLERGSD